MQRNNMNWNVKQLVRYIDEGKVTLDNPIQRGAVWDVYRKSLLIHSILAGYPIPALYFLRVKSTHENDTTNSNSKSGSFDVYDNFDGKQRSLAFYDFLKDNFRLVDHKDITPVPNEEGELEDVRGLYFSNLPEWAQDRIISFNLTIYYFDDMSESEIKEFFRRLNNGKPLSSIEITRVQTKNLAVFQNLAKHSAIDFVTTKAAKKGFADENIAMQLYHIATEETPNFSTKPFREWAKEVDPDESIIAEIVSALDLIDEFMKTYKDKQLLQTIKKKTHFVAATYACYFAQKHNYSKQHIFQALAAFFFSPIDEYSRTAGSGSAKTANVLTRKEIMMELMQGKYDEELSIPNAVNDV